jgi:hypothetical protein
VISYCRQGGRIETSLRVVLDIHSFEGEVNFSARAKQLRPHLQRAPEYCNIQPLAPNNHNAVYAKSGRTLSTTCPNPITATSSSPRLRLPRRPRCAPQPTRERDHGRTSRSKIRYTLPTETQLIIITVRFLHHPRGYPCLIRHLQDDPGRELYPNQMDSGDLQRVRDEMGTTE